MPPGVVSFDLDGTLWEFSPMMDGAIAAAIASLERRHPELAGRLTVADLHEHRRLIGRGDAGHARGAAPRLVPRKRCESVGDDPQLAEWMADELLAARADVVVLHDDVEPAVDGCSRAGTWSARSRTATSRSTGWRWRRTSRSSCTPSRSAEISPGPSRSPGGRAGRRRPARWVHVGDELGTDIDGAQALRDAGACG